MIVCFIVKQIQLYLKVLVCIYGKTDKIAHIILIYICGLKHVYIMDIGSNIFLYARPGVTKFGPGGPVSLQSLAPTLIKHTWTS